VRVLIALNSYEEDGPGHLLYRLAQRWSPLQDVRIATVALSRGGPMRDRYRDLGIPTEIVPSRGRGGIARLRAWARELAGRADKPALVHSHLLWPDLALRLVHADLGRLPLVSTCHGLHALDEKGRALGLVYRALERATRARCRAWVAVSEDVRRAMVASGYPADRVYLVRNGVDGVQTYPIGDHRKAELRAILNVPEGAPLIGAAGTLRTLKGHDVLVRAMPAILARQPETRLYIFGNGDERDNLLALAESLGVGHRVRIIGALCCMLPEVLSTLDVLVHPSRIEAFGLVVAEAQAAGTPVVASRVGGIPENVRHGETGFLVEPDQPGEIAARVLELLDDPDKRQAFGEAGRAFVLAEREIGHTAEGYRELWRKIAGWNDSALLRLHEEDEEEARMLTPVPKLDATPFPVKDRL
jgi:glycosyltransferase involved in cell wall biosynthesis